MDQPLLRPTEAKRTPTMPHPFDEILSNRRTAKVLRQVDKNVPLAEDVASELRTAVEEMLAGAAWAPFHYPAPASQQGAVGQSSVVPWRCYVLEKPACDQLIERLRQQALATDADIKWTDAWKSKLPLLLAGTGVLVQVTWLPDPATDAATETSLQKLAQKLAQELAPELSKRNVEHIAAAACAVQNLMLAGEARGYHTYWSSGGILRDPEVFRWLSIPAQQQLLGAIFIAPPAQPHTEVRPGALREKRGEVADWSTWVRLD